MFKPSVEERAKKARIRPLVGISMLLTCLSVSAAEWSDTSIGYRYGTDFGEPFEGNGIHKNIIDLQHASGYAYGQNFVNIDFLFSDHKDPSTVGGSGATEAYAVYRNTIDVTKVTGLDMKYPGYVKGVGLTLGFDVNTKNDVGYASKKRMLVIGPTVSFDVPAGFWNMGVLLLNESNAPVGHPERYTYKPHFMLTSAWLIPFGESRISFEGFVNYIASKGKDEFGGFTKPETDFDGQIMADVGAMAGGAKGFFKVGVEYQFWKNKFGNDHNGPAGSGAFAKTPMVRAEYHF